MIEIILKGGLGNQMFQYAAAKALALNNNTNVKINLSFLNLRIPVKHFSYRSYDLDLFDISPNYNRPLYSEFIDRYITYPLTHIWDTAINPNYYQQPINFYAYDSKFTNIRDNSRIEGYFNNHKYFLGYDNDIKSIFNTDLLYDTHFDDIEDRIAGSNSVSINIRRGDYLNTKNNRVFVTLSSQYYINAVKIIREKVKVPHFFIFCFDKPDWHPTDIGITESEYTFLGPEYIGDRFATYMRLISLCKHNIISNSTFAWWGAYLNKNSDKLIISPKSWSYLYNFEAPPEWITIDNK